MWEVIAFDYYIINLTKPLPSDSRLCHAIHALYYTVLLRLNIKAFAYIFFFTYIFTLFIFMCHIMFCHHFVSCHAFNLKVCCEFLGTRSGKKYIGLDLHYLESLSPHLSLNTETFKTFTNEFRLSNGKELYIIFIRHRI